MSSPSFPSLPLISLPFHFSSSLFLFRLSLPRFLLLFTVPSHSPSLSLSLPLPRYDLVVQARDGGTPPRIGTANLIVRVVNINDNSPRFDRSFFVAQVAEGQSAHTYIV